MRRLAFRLSVVASALIVAMLVVTAATGATQEAHEYTVTPAQYAASLLEDPGATRLLFALDLAFLVVYTRSSSRSATSCSRAAPPARSSTSRSVGSS